MRSRAEVEFYENIMIALLRNPEYFRLKSGLGDYTAQADRIARKAVKDREEFMRDK